MNEQLFYQAVVTKAQEYNLNPLLLLSGIEGLYSFKDVDLTSLNYSFLDSLILTIFTLRIGDSFHSIAEGNLISTDNAVSKAAGTELRALTNDEISNSSNRYLQSFAQIVNGSTVIRKYHEKALEVAALEIQMAHGKFQNTSIGAIVLEICKKENDLNFLFNK